MTFRREDKILIIGQHKTSRTEAIADYLRPRVKQLFVIALGSAFAEDKQNYLFYYENGNLKKQIIFSHPWFSKIRQQWLLISLAFYFYIYDILRMIISCRSSFALCIGIAHFSGLAGLLFKKARICRRNVYYTIDYYAAQERENWFNSLFLRISNFTDKISVYYSDEVWDISPRISQGRLEFSRIRKEVYGEKHRIVPLGYSKHFFRNEDIKKIEMNSLAFVGVIVKGQGLELLLEALPEISGAIPRIKIKIIGSGPFLSEFKKMAEASAYREIFEFYGFIADEKKMLDIISSSALGISIWDKQACSLNFYYGDPGKTKLYTVCGLPVIVSRDTVFSRIVAQDKAGVAIGYDKDELIGALKTILSDVNTYAAYKSNALMVAQDYCDAEKIFSQVLN